MRVLALVGGLILGIAGAAWAPIHTSYCPQRIADEATVLVTGEITALTAVGPTELPGGHSIAAMLVRADIHVLRVFPGTTKCNVRPGQTVKLLYETYDASHWAGGRCLLMLAVGQRYVFPLKEWQDAPQAGWRMVHHEDVGILVPCSERGLPGAAPSTAHDFLLAEYAGALTSEDSADAFAAGRYARHLSAWPEGDNDVTQVFALVEEEIGDDRQRWIDAAVALHASSGYPRPGIVDLLADLQPRPSRSARLLTALVFDRIRGPDVHERIIETALARAQEDASSVAGMLLLDYSRHPLVVERLREGLAADDAVALQLAQWLVRDMDHPLREAATAAASRMLPGLPAPVRPPLLPSSWCADESVTMYWQTYSMRRAVCKLLVGYGDADQWAALVAHIKQAQATDHERFAQLYRFCTDTRRSDRLIAMAKIGIDDSRIPWPDAPVREGESPYRFCDYARSAVFRATDQDFGINWRDGMTDEERELGVERAQQWLVENTDYVSPVL